MNIFITTKLLLTFKTRKNEKEYHHFAFGLFIEEVLKCEKVVVSAMCQAIGMSKETYEMLKKGMISV
ncbi:hypothetical protein NXY28_27150 [Bacteroides thetaiotaomicron]|nr:hypothetical protein NXY28_27150 [Bacteroides thetaiotaomicron]